MLSSKLEFSLEESVREASGEGFNFDPSSRLGIYVRVPWLFAADRFQGPGSFGLMIRFENPVTPRAAAAAIDLYESAFLWSKYGRKKIGCQDRDDHFILRTPSRLMVTDIGADLDEFAPFVVGGEKSGVGQSIEFCGKIVIEY